MPISPHDNTGTYDNYGLDDFAPGERVILDENLNEIKRITFEASGTVEKGHPLDGHDFLMIDLDHYILSGNGDQFYVDDDHKTSAQHYATVEGDDKITVFDNGNGRDPQQTRIMEYIVNTNEMTQTPTTLYEPTGKFSAACGSVQVLEGKKLVIGWGKATKDHDCLSVVDISSNRSTNRSGSPLRRTTFRSRPTLRRASSSWPPAIATCKLAALARLFHRNSPTDRRASMREAEAWRMDGQYARCARSGSVADGARTQDQRRCRHALPCAFWRTGMQSPRTARLAKREGRSSLRPWRIVRKGTPTQGNRFGGLAVSFERKLI